MKNYILTEAIILKAVQLLLKVRKPTQEPVYMGLAYGSPSHIYGYGDISCFVYPGEDPREKCLENWREQRAEKVLYGRFFRQARVIDCSLVRQLVEAWKEKEGSYAQ